MTLLYRLELLRLLRDPTMLISILVSPVVTCALLADELVRQPPDGLGSRAYVLVSMAATGVVFAGLSGTATAIAKDRGSGWYRQLAAGPSGARGYLAMRLLTVVPLCLLSATGVLLVGSRLDSVTISGAHLAATVLVLWAGSAVYCLFGCACGLLLTEKTVGLPVLVGVWGFNILGGLLWPVDTFPGWLRLPAELTPTYHLGELAHQAQLGETPGAVHLAALTGYTALGTVLLVLAHRRSRARI
ncbi:ABC transporter permease [Kitasatospora sp. NPDC056446]|uniref:ABC transporter permease n=1 Tax=Kitasatospora sp. NPDC056446 TaxID=3345819 RepID=UPI003686C83C